MNREQILRIPGFTAERALEQGGGAYAGLAGRAAGRTVEPAWCETNCSQWGDGTWGCHTKCYGGHVMM